jgi:hypothetical protein
MTPWQPCGRLGSATAIGLMLELARALDWRIMEPVRCLFGVPLTRVP